ncbi:MAG: hypothetical protein ACMXYM_02950 [Candidatus Woesearchaeota archaeon]
MKTLIILTCALLFLAGCAETRVEEPAPEPIVLSYSYGTRGAQTMPFGDEGPIVLTCEEYYRMD